MKRDMAYYTHCKNRLARSPLFTGLSDELMDDMLEMFRRDSWRRGVQLDPSLFQQRLFLLVDGRVEVTRINPQTGRSITLFLLGPGDGIDMITLLNDRPHEMTPVALDDVSLISVPLGDARAWLEKHPEFNRNFLPYLGEQMRKLEDLATDLALHDTMTRLARLILRHVKPCNSGPTTGERSLHLINDLHDESLARMVGSVRQVVNRHLQHWRKQGILHKRHFQTVVTELESLQDYADESPTHGDTEKTGSQ
ncbi:transcriptional regulator [Thiogranum longum]|uniref:Transcriptional regulator n=1 Tax=Thiogranum longum TaxID=1537524 RepID=A0A4V2PGQ7_9GAMM|nr:Crp/Fnr family transcriptional regulator [Thiogranum longum]TCK17756.1 transcriptional regulator [Thiogranum longum]